MRTRSLRCLSSSSPKTWTTALGPGPRVMTIIYGDLAGSEGYEESFAFGYQVGPDWSAIPDYASCELAINVLLEPDNLIGSILGFGSRTLASALKILASARRRSWKTMQTDTPPSSKRQRTPISIGNT